MINNQISDEDPLLTVHLSEWLKLKEKADAAESRGTPDGNSLYYYSLWKKCRLENDRLREIKEKASLMRDTIEGLANGSAQRPETVRAALHLVVRAYDEDHKNYV